MNKVAFVTGASRGIGRETALAFARAGFDLAIRVAEGDFHGEKSGFGVADRGDAVDLAGQSRIDGLDTDLGRVERVNALSRRLCAGPLPPEKFRQAVEEVRNAPAYPDAAQCAMYAVISAAFSVFFGCSRAL